MFIEKNNAIRADIFKQLERITDEEFNQKPKANAWSPKEIINHLIKMEHMIVNGIKRQLENPESPKVKKKPIRISTLRIIKVQAPAHTVPTSEYKTKEEMKNALHETRMELLSVYKSANKETFQSKSLKHPIFGQVPLIQWFTFVGLHEKRHLKQLEKTIEKIKGHKK